MNNIVVFREQITAIIKGNTDDGFYCPDPIAVHEYPTEESDPIDYSSKREGTKIYGVGPAKIMIGCYDSFVNEARSWLNIKINEEEYHLFAAVVKSVCDSMNVPFLELDF